jgi:hypothetical protein
LLIELISFFIAAPNLNPIELLMLFIPWLWAYMTFLLRWHSWVIYCLTG